VSKPAAAFHIEQVSKKVTPIRVERYWVGGKKRDLEVYQIPLEHLYFNIENGRYRDRMLQLRHEHQGVEIDPRDDRWKTKVERMLAGEHKDTSRDKGPFETLIRDLEEREQLRAGVVLADGGVIDGNRRLAALRRLHAQNSRSAKFRYFDAVILPDDTTAEDRWRIEAGLQLGTNERWDYSPVNEMLKIREGVDMYEGLIRAHAFPRGQSAVKLVTQAVYGKSEGEIQELLSRLRLIDEYLEFTNQVGAYHQVGGTSEDFKEANRIMTAAENQQLDPPVLAKIRAVLFYEIDRDLMSNWQLRKIYDALGGDPKKGGKKQQPNKAALDELLAEFPSPLEIQQDLLQARNPVVQPPPARPTPPAGGKAGAAGGKPAPDKKTSPALPPPAPPPPAPPKPAVDKAKVEAATVRFLHKVETSGKTRSLRKTAEGARGSLQALEADLSKPEVRDALEADERVAILEAVESMQGTISTCLAFLRPPKPVAPVGQKPKAPSKAGRR
jgi:hypothetical protein